jgi:F-type H+-transporting ATPase subunit b
MRALAAAALAGVALAGESLAAEAAGAGYDLAFYQEPEFWLTVAFTIFVALMAKPVWRKVTGGLDARAAQIQAELDEARKLREEAQAQLASYQRKQRDAAKEAQEILAHTEDEAGRITAEAETRLAEVLERHREIAADRITQAEARAVEEVKAQAVEAALAATARLIADKMDQSKADALIDDAIKELPGKLR